MMEMRMITDLNTALPAEIVFNFEELEAELKGRLHHYKTLVVTEDAIQEGKADLASLRKLREAIETRRKEVKKLCAQPYNAFEAKVKKLVTLIDEPITVIDNQVKEFARMEQQKKREEIEASYEELVPESIRDIIPLERILDPKWLNKTTTMKAVNEAIEALVKRTNVDMILIASVDPEYMAGVRAKYAETLDITAAMEYQKELQRTAELFRQQEEATARTAELFRQQEEAAARLHAKENVREVQEPIEEKVAPQAVQEPAESTRQEETIHSLRLELRLTSNQAKALKAFLNTNNIQYTRI